MSTTSNLSRFASLLSVANLSMAQKQIAPTTTIIKTAPTTNCRGIGAAAREKLIGERKIPAPVFLIANPTALNGSPKLGPTGETLLVLPNRNRIPQLGHPC